MDNKTIRLILPQWQGGNRYVYAFGAKLLEWLAPAANCETLEIPLIPKTPEIIKDGIAFKEELLRHSGEIYRLLQSKSPDKIIVFGGDCSISLAPFTYLLEKYEGDAAVLWLDRHGDISVPGETTDYHAMVLASFLGEGDTDFSDFVKVKLDTEHLLHIGVNDPAKEFGRKIGNNYDFKNILPEEFAENSSSVIATIKDMHIRKLIIHFDLDVLDLSSFRSQSSANPSVYFERLKLIRPGASFQSLSRLLNDLDKQFDIVGLSLAEYLPWDAMNLANLLAGLPLLKDKI